MPTDMPEENSNRSLIFTRMAARIEANKCESFGGAFVIVPPSDGGSVIDTLVLDNRQDATQFWILLKSKCDTALVELDQKQRQQSTFGRR